MVNNLLKDLNIFPDRVLIYNYVYCYSRYYNQRYDFDHGYFKQSCNPYLYPSLFLSDAQFKVLTGPFTYINIDSCDLFWKKVKDKIIVPIDCWYPDPDIEANY